MNESLEVRLARMEEKFDHLIHASEDAGRERRDINRQMKVEMEKLDKRLETVEEVVLTARVSWRTLVKITTLYATLTSVVIGAIYELAKTFSWFK